MHGLSKDKDGRITNTYLESGAWVLLSIWTVVISLMAPSVDVKPAPEKSDDWNLARPASAREKKGGGLSSMIPLRYESTTGARISSTFERRSRHEMRGARRTMARENAVKKHIFTVSKVLGSVGKAYEEY